MAALLSVPGAILLVAAGIWAFSMPLWWWITDVPIVLPIIIGFIDITVLLIVLHKIIGERHDDEIYAGERKRRQARQQSLVGAWASAQHRKVCPLIEFEKSA